MLTTCVLAAVFALPQQKFDNTQPNPEEKEALAALKKIGFEVVRVEDCGFAYGTWLQHRFNWPGHERRVLTAEALAPLAKLPRTRVLILGGPGVRDETLKVVGGLAHLESLYLHGAGITDEGLARLTGLKKLKFLLIESSTVTLKSWKVFAKLPALQSLCMKRLRVRGEGLRELAHAPQLTTLALNETGSTNNDLMAVATPGAFPGLTCLDLRGAAITDEGLKALHDPAILPALRILKVRTDGTRVTAAGKERLQKARPLVELTAQ